MKNIHIKPTDKPSKIRIGNNRNFVIGLTQSATVSKNDSYTNQNIYITSDEEIKEGDWVIQVNFEKTNIQLIQCITKFQTKIANNKDGSFTKNKIILTTDPTLIADGVQSIDDDFLEWFVKNPSCVEVEVKKGFADGSAYGYDFLSYKIIIPKEEPMKQTDKAHLQWIHDRIVNVYGENENVDFLIKMREIISNVNVYDNTKDKRKIMKQTVVEWLVENLHLHNDVYFVTKDKRKIIEQAREMEEEQRIMDYNEGHTDGLCNHINDADNYINEQKYNTDTK
jgi:hypothetical protein